MSSILGDKMLTFHFAQPGDYSEQQLLDCGYGKHKAYGCDGVRRNGAYLRTIVQDKIDLASEVNIAKNLNS